MKKGKVKAKYTNSNNKVLGFLHALDTQIANMPYDLDPDEVYYP
jgi:hypothetical protein